MTMVRDLLLHADHRLALVAHRLVQALGFRGAALASFATFDLVWAWSLIDPAAAKALKVAPTYHVLLRVAPLVVWAAILASVGILCGIQAWMRDDRAAFAAAIGVKLMWAALTVATWPTAGLQVLRPTIVFLTLAALVSVCAAGLPFSRE